MAKDCQQFHKTSETSSSVEYFKANFSRISGTNANICLMEAQLGTDHQNQIFLKFLNILRSWRCLYKGHVDVHMISKTGGKKNRMKKNHDLNGMGLMK